MNYSITHQYFLACGKIWRDYFNEKISMLERDRMIHWTRNRFFG